MKNKILTRLLKVSEARNLKIFIKKNYDTNHTLVKNRKILNHYFIRDRKINFVGTFENNELKSILGLLSNRNWDVKLNNDLQLSMWISDKSKKNSYGLNNLIYILNYIKPFSLFTSGLNPNTSGKVYQIFGSIKKFDHYYLSNPNIKPRISKGLISFKKKVKKINYENKKLVVEKKIKMLPQHSYYPKKSKKFFYNKYINNPFYNYFLINIYIGRILKCFFVCREIKVKKLNRKIIRIVDFYGNLPKNVSVKDCFEDFIIKKNYEYIDFLVYGLKSSFISSIGFKKKNKNQMIPGYFEPFIKKNRNVYLAILKNPYFKKLLSVKADSDQEIPRQF